MAGGERSHFKFACRSARGKTEGRFCSQPEEGFVQICPEIVSSAVLRVPVLFLQKQKEGKILLHWKENASSQMWCKPVWTLRNVLATDARYPKNYNGGDERLYNEDKVRLRQKVSRGARSEVKQSADF